jgi:hypothetical protein
MEVVILGTAALVLGAGGVLLARVRRALEPVRSLRLAADAGGLVDVEVERRALLRPVVRGRSGDLVVRLSEHRGDPRQHGVRVTITAPGSDLDALTLRPESLRTAMEKQLGRPEIETGDDPFDAAFFVAGPEPMARARLHEPVRRRLLHLQGQMEISLLAGELKATIPAPLKVGLDDPLCRLLPVLIEVGHGLADAIDVPRRLADHARGEPRAAARRLSLHALLAVTSTANPHRQDALRAAGDDPDPGVRLDAALERGPEGVETLQRLAEALDVPEEVGARAIAHLGRQLPFERAQMAAERALSQGQSRVAVAALGAIAAHGTPEAEALLIRALAWNLRGADVAAAEGLRRIGTAAAVLPLKEAASRDAGRAFRVAVEQAITTIQARLDGAAPGQLSLAPTEAGRLSVGATERGQLSVADVNVPRPAEPAE